MFPGNGIQPILLATATLMEAQPALQHASVVKEVGKDLFFCQSASGDYQVLITGIGSPLCSYRLTRHFIEHPCRWMIHYGIAGSFRKDIPLGTVVEVMSDRFADLGIESEAGIVTLAEAGLVSPGMKPFTGEELINAHSFSGIALTTVVKTRGITVNTVTGKDNTAEKLSSRFHADVETMESAACFYVCLMEGIPFYALRGISNYVGNRDRSSWNIALALDKVTDKVFEIMKSINA